jgi:hypothetical protein
MGNGERWWAWVPTLARQFRIVRLDAREHGQSSIPRSATQRSPREPLASAPCSSRRSPIAPPARGTPAG